MDEAVRILFVDDEKNVLKSLERLFLDSDYEILTSVSAEEGLEILESVGPVQLVISDYRMPGMNGVDFLVKVREHWPETIRIILSGYADAGAIVEAINKGKIYKFMPKPWNDHELKVAVLNALDHYSIQGKNVQLTQELEAKNKELQITNESLEKLVKENGFDLMIQKKILASSRNILDFLPVGVIGIDPVGTIVQCNKKGLDLLGENDGDILGLDKKEAFTEEIINFIDRVSEEGTQYESVSVGGNAVKIKGVYMSGSGGQEGIILVVDEVVADGG